MKIEIKKISLEKKEKNEDLSKKDEKRWKIYRNKRLKRRTIEKTGKIETKNKKLQNGKTIDIHFFCMVIG